MNQFLNKRMNNKEIQFQTTQNKILNYQNNSNNKKYYSTSINSYTKINIKGKEKKMYNQPPKNSDLQSFESLNEPSNPNDNMNNMNSKNNTNNYYEKKITEYSESPYNTDYFYNYRYYDPSLSRYNSLPLSINDNINETIYNNNIPIQNNSNNNEYIKYNPNYFNQRKKIMEKKKNKNKLTINNICNNNFIPKKTINNINNSKYGELSKKTFLNENSAQYYDSFNNNFINYIVQNNYEEDSFNEDKKEDNNSNTQINKLTRYDIRKKKSITEGQTFFIKKADNPKNYKFFESKRIPTNNHKQNLLKTNTTSNKKINNNSNINKVEIKTEKKNLKENIYTNNVSNNNISNYLEKEENDEFVNNHNFIIIRPSSKQNKKKEENDSKVKVDNYKYKEIKVKGPDNYKPVMKLRIGINGEKFYEKFVPEKKVIKYTYEPICKIINSKNMNNVAFKKIVSNYHSGIRKKYKKINPDLLTKPASNVIITNDFYSYEGNVLENIKDQKTNVINNNLKEEKNDEKILKNKNKRKSKAINEQNNNDKNE